jgi:hypothetical protein
MLKNGDRPLKPLDLRLERACPLSQPCSCLLYIALQVQFFTDHFDDTAGKIDRADHQDCADDTAPQSAS